MISGLYDWPMMVQGCLMITNDWFLMVQWWFRDGTDWLMMVDDSEYWMANHHAYWWLTMYNAHIGPPKMVFLFGVPALNQSLSIITPYLSKTQHISALFTMDSPRPLGLQCPWWATPPLRPPVLVAWTVSAWATPLAEGRRWAMGVTKNPQKSVAEVVNNCG